VDVITTGNHVWQKREIMAYLRESERLLRPINMAPEAPGVGATVRTGRRGGPPVGVLNLIGRVFMGHSDCPFRAAAGAVARLRAQTPILVDMRRPRRGWP
jgi:calcineurin-like phosphoesterase